MIHRIVRPATSIVLLAGLLSIFAEAARAQSVPRVVTGWGIDTTTAAWSEQAWHADAVAIFRQWRTYLQSSPERQAPTALWSATEQQGSAVFDHTAGAAYKGFPATVLDIRPLDPAAPDTFVIRTLFANADASNDVRPVALTRVYAFRENGRWVFGSALVRAIRDWTRTRVASFTFIAPPDAPIDVARARGTVAFADSLADALGVERLRDVDYIVASSPEALHRIMGVDWTFGALGHGYALPGMILSGDARFREANRHEIVHLVVQPIVRERRTHGIIAEGVATRYGGSVGRTFAELLIEYAAYLTAHPDVDLDAVLNGTSGADIGWRPAGAVLVDMVLDHGGAGALLTLLHSGRSSDELRATMSTLLGVPWSDVASSWRRRILDSADR